MPRGVDVELDNGTALIDFTDPSLRGPTLGRLKLLGARVGVDTSGRRKRYRVSEGAAVAVGVVDVPRISEPPPKPAPPPPPSEPVVPAVAVQEPVVPVKRLPGRPRKLR
jgi:hypothetical protein